MSKNRQRAFPLPVSDNNLGYEGMELRDYFAAAALQGLLLQGYDKFCPEEWANQAFSYADAMLKAREL